MLETLLQASDTEERCGILLKDGSVLEVANIAEDRKHSYEMNPIPILAYIDDELIAATWHTHPDSSPNLSGEDYAGFLSWPDLEHIIIGRQDGKVVEVRYKIEEGLVIVCD